MRRIVILMATVLFISPGTRLLAEAGSDTIRVTLYQSPRCKYCLSVKKEIIPRLLKKYPDTITFVDKDTSKAESLQEFIALCEQYHVNASVPAVYIELTPVEEYLFVGADNIENNIFKLIDGFLTSRGPVSRQAPRSTKISERR